MKNALFHLVALALVLCLPAGARADGNDPTLEEMLRAFDVIAFGSEAKELQERGTLLKWDRAEIAVNMTRFHSAVDSELKPLPARDVWAGYAWEHLRTLERLTGLGFVDSITAKKRPRLTIVFTPRKLLSRVPIPGVGEKLQRELAAPGGCYFLTFATGRQGTLDRAFVVVNTERDGFLIDHCLLEELTQSLGLPNDSDIIRPSIFSDHDRLRRLSAADEILIKTLYNKRMLPGMSREAANVTARLLIAQQLAARR